MNKTCRTELNMPTYASWKSQKEKREKRRKILEEIKTDISQV